MQEINFIPACISRGICTLCICIKKNVIPREESICKLSRHVLHLTTAYGLPFIPPQLSVYISVMLYVQRRNYHEGLQMKNQPMTKQSLVEITDGWGGINFKWSP